MTIGIVWIEHNALTEALERVDAGFLRLNLLLLLLVGFLPYPTRVMEEYLSLVDTEHGGERTAVAFFGIVLFLMSLMLIVLGSYAEREGLFGGDAAEERPEENRVTYQLAPSLVFYAVATVLRPRPALRRRGPLLPHRRLPAPARSHGAQVARAQQLTGGRASSLRSRRTQRVSGK